LTIDLFRQNLGDMGAFMTKYLMIAVLLLLGACAVKPPVQEMAEARSAIERAQQLKSDNPRAEEVLKSAEQTLKEAAAAIDSKHYEAARRKAVEAKRKAQMAAKFKHASSGR